jgi:hypothetical protein
MTKSIATTVSSWVRKALAPLRQTVSKENDLSSVQYSGYLLRVRVKKSSDSLFWYTKHIGETFVVKATDIDRVWVKEPDEYGALNFILKVDIEVVVP